MALGFEVNKQILDMKAAQTVIGLREAFDNVDAIATWLENHPVIEGDDPLMQEPFGYTQQEAHALRFYFETFSAVRSANETAFDTGRMMSGLD